MKFMSLSEFSHCKNPLTARASFYLDHAIEDVSEEWGYTFTSSPCSSVIENGVTKIRFFDYEKRQDTIFILFENGEVKKTKSITHKKTGRKIFNDDIQILDEYETIYELEDSVHSVVENFIELCSSESGIETIACNLIMMITDESN